MKNKGHKVVFEMFSELMRGKLEQHAGIGNYT